MAQSYTKKECCQLLAVSYRDLAKLLTRASIVVTVASNDHRAQVITEDQLATLRQLVALDGRQPPSDSVPSSDLLARLAALESLTRRQAAQIAALERDIGTIRASQNSAYAPVTRYNGQETASRDEVVSSISLPTSRLSDGHRSASFSSSVVPIFGTGWAQGENGLNYDKEGRLTAGEIGRIAEAHRPGSGQTARKFWAEKMPDETRHSKEAVIAWMFLNREHMRPCGDTSCPCATLLNS